MSTEPTHTPWENVGATIAWFYNAVRQHRAQINVVKDAAAALIVRATA